MRSVRWAVAVAAVVITIPIGTAASSSAPGAAPPAEHTRVEGPAVPRTCLSSLRPGARGVAVTSWTAPASGFLDVRSSGADGGDWDLAVFDAGNGRALATSEAFGSREV